jgi:hypothetical protein
VGTVASGGGLCLELDGEWRCGCESETDCDQGLMCCDNRCVEHDAENCIACGEGCSITTGGLFCEDTSGTLDGPWQCECNGNHAMCRGQYDFSMATCSEDQCFCGLDVNNQPFMCEGTVIDMCCVDNFEYKCVDLTSNVLHCGICGSVCADGQTCVNGVCSCATDIDCDVVSSGMDCDTYNNGLGCVCSPFSDVPCWAGQYCCEYIGCCLIDCDDSPVDCSNTCAIAGNTWCWWGCCEDCVDESECDAHAP